MEVFAGKFEYFGARTYNQSALPKDQWYCDSKNDKLKDTDFYALHYCRFEPNFQVYFCETRIYTAAFRSYYAVRFLILCKLSLRATKNLCFVKFFRICAAFNDRL